MCILFLTEVSRALFISYKENLWSCTRPECLKRFNVSGLIIMDRLNSGVGKRSNENVGWGQRVFFFGGGGPQWF